jgi:SAM-dependent methyltransferase
MESTIASDAHAGVQRGAAFEDRLLGVVNSAALALGLSIGHRTGLLDAMAGLEPATSEEIATASRLNERYVREWLGAMVTGGIVDYFPFRKQYHLPPEHAALLTRGGEANFAAILQYVPVLGQVEDRLVDCFRHGGGVGYEHFHRFHDVMAEDSGQTVVAALFDSILPLAHGLESRLEAGVDVLDVGCGQGRALLEMAARYPTSHFTGYDLSREAIGRARQDARERGLANLRFEVRDLELMRDDSAYDLVTGFDIVHDQRRPDVVLRNIRRALRSDGLFLMQDIAASSNVEKNIGHPIGPFLYTISLCHCMPVSLAREGMGLGACWGRELALQMLAEAGFTRVDVRDLPHDIQNHFYLATP